MKKSESSIFNLLRGPSRNTFLAVLTYAYGPLYNEYSVFIDVRIFNPQGQSNWTKSIPAMYTSHQNYEKKSEDRGRRIVVGVTGFKLTISMCSLIR